MKQKKTVDNDKRKKPENKTPKKIRTNTKTNPKNYSAHRKCSIEDNWKNTILK